MNEPVSTITQDHLRQFKVAVLWFVGVVLGVCLIAFGGYELAMRNIAAQGEKDKAAANVFKGQAQVAAKDAQDFHAAGDKLTPKLVVDTQRTARAHAAVVALKLPDKLPDTPQFVPVAAYREEVAALTVENTDLRSKLALKTMEADSWHQAYVKSDLRALALEGQMAARRAEQHRAVLGATIKGTFYGVALDEAVRAIIHLK